VSTPESTMPPLALAAHRNEIRTIVLAHMLAHMLALETKKSTDFSVL